jgi:hypothetical protein
VSEENYELNDSDYASMSEGIANVTTDLGQGSENAEGPAVGAPASPLAAPVPALPDPYAQAPKSWKKDHHERYAKADPEMRQYIHQREEEFLRGIGGYKKDAEFGTRLREKLQPFQGLLDQHGVDPIQAFDSLFRAHVGLTMGNADERKQWAQYIVQNYGLDALVGLAQGNAQDPASNPVVQQLQSRVEQMQSVIFEDKRAAIESEIKIFASDPKNKYFDELFDDMKQLIEEGRAKNIASAYEQAQWLNPEVRAKLMADAVKEATAVTPQPSLRKAPAPSAPPLRSSAEPVSPSAKRGSIDDSLNEAYARAIQS